MAHQRLNQRGISRTDFELHNKLALRVNGHGIPNRLRLGFDIAMSFIHLQGLTRQLLGLAVVEFLGVLSTLERQTADDAGMTAGFAGRPFDGHPLADQFGDINRTGLWDFAIP